MNWFKRKKRTSGNQEIRNWDIGVSGYQGTDRISGYPEPVISQEHPEPGAGNLPLTSALFTGFLIRLRRIPRLFKPWMNAVKSRGAVRYFLEWRNIEQVDSATRQRITPMSMAKLSFHLSTLCLEKANEKRISPYHTNRGKPATTGS